MRTRRLRDAAVRVGLAGQPGLTRVRTRISGTQGVREESTGRSTGYTADDRRGDTQGRGTDRRTGGRTDRRARSGVRAGEGHHHGRPDDGSHAGTDQRATDTAGHCGGHAEGDRTCGAAERHTDDGGGSLAGRFVLGNPDRDEALGDLRFAIGRPLVDRDPLTVGQPGSIAFELVFLDEEVAHAQRLRGRGNRADRRDRAGQGVGLRRRRVVDGVVVGLVVRLRIGVGPVWRFPGRCRDSARTGVVVVARRSLLRRCDRWGCVVAATADPTLLESIVGLALVDTALFVGCGRAVDQEGGAEGTGNHQRGKHCPDEWGGWWGGAVPALCPRPPGRGVEPRRRDRW